jgi:hypothetical protein
MNERSSRAMHAIGQSGRRAARFVRRHTLPLRIALLALAALLVIMLVADIALDEPLRRSVRTPIRSLPCSGCRG